MEKRGTRVVLQLARLARTSWGILLTQCLQLITSLIHSRTDYAASVWHQLGRSSATVKTIQRINNVAQRFALGVFRTHPLIFLKHDTDSPSALARLDAKAQEAIARLLPLPASNPAAALAREALATPRKAHQSKLHHTLHSSSSTLSSLPAPIETISLGPVRLPPHPRLTSLIARNRAAARAFTDSQLIPLTRNISSRAILVSDGSLILDEGVGAAAIHLPTGLLSPANLGSST